MTMRSHSKRPLPFAAVLALAASTTAGAAGLPEAAPRLTFRSEVEVVNLSLTATDAHSQFVNDLTEQEIAIFEDGVPQKVALFSRERLPLSLCVLVDGSASMEPKLRVARSAAERLVRTLRAEDEGSVAVFNHRYQILQEFTTDHALLEAALTSIRADGSTGLYSALYVALRDLTRRGVKEGPRRRAIVVLSDGEDTSSLVGDEQVLELARKAGVAVYAISLRPQRIDLQSDQHRATYFMTTIAKDTGGRVFFPASLRDLDAVYGTVAEELRTQYGVGYVSSNPLRDGKWRRIDIHSARGTLLLRHRPGYYAPRGVSRAVLAGPERGPVVASASGSR